MALGRPLLLLLPLTFLAGCGSRATPDIAPEDTSTRLAETTDLDVKGWLDKPRAELAKLADEHKAAVDQHLDRLRNDPASATLLPSLRLPVQGVVFHQAAFRPDLGVSLPEYVKTPDAAIAGHLARFGDHEAAAKLGAAPKAGRNYPVEWTRAVGWALTAAEFKLATGDPQAAADLVQAHKQLSEILDDGAKKGDLGAALLGSGKRSLFLASRAWRDPKVNLTALASDLDDALAAWGDVPAPRFPALTRAGVAGVWGTPTPGSVVVATGEARARVFDLLGPALPSEGTQALAAFLDADGNLAEVQAAYRSGLDTLYPEPADLAYRLEERGLLAGKEEKTAGAHRQSFAGTDVTVDVLRTNRSPALGALVRVVPAKPTKPAAGPDDGRAFGPANLDRPFESCRLLLDPRLTGNLLAVNDKPVVARVAAGLAVPTPTGAGVERDGELVGRVQLTWPTDLPTADAGKLIAGLWAAYGCPAVGESADGLALTWAKEKTKVEFRLPFDEKAPTLAAADAQPKDKQEARLKAAWEREKAERDARVAAGAADERLATGPGKVNGLSLPGLKLGATKEVAEAALPASRDYRKKVLADGISVLIDTPAEKAAFWAKQLLVRYADGKVAEIRVRYLEADTTSLRAGLTADPKVGAGEDVEADWAALWADFPGAAATKTRWRDDRTERTYQRDAAGSEVAWRARGEARPWRFVTAGIAPVGVGSTREQFASEWGKPATTSGEALVFRMPAKSAYEMALVWFDGEKATRVLGVHRERPAGDAPEQVNAALQRAWAKDLGGLGFTRRSDVRRGEVLGGLYWHDDEVRVHTTVQDAEGGLRLVTEWRAWPFARPAVAAK